ncbi:MAG: hydrogenase maturation protease [Holophagaceae bacterium]
MDGTALALKPLVVFGWGNPGRGDDALGPRLLARVEIWAEAQAEAPLEAIPDFQLQIEHVEDLRGRDLALFLDASVAAPAPFAFREAHPAPDASFTSHALSPEALLHAFARVTGTPPPAFVLAVRGERFELGEDLGPSAERNLEAAWRFLQGLLSDPDPARWRRLAED